MIDTLILKVYCRVIGIIGLTSAALGFVAHLALYQHWLNLAILAPLLPFMAYTAYHELRASRIMLSILK